MSKFINLHFNSEYSLLESSVTIDSYVSFAIENNISTLTITDHNNMYGVDKFIHLCKKHNIKPIIGVDLDVQDFRLILLAKNYLGFQELNRLVSLKTKKNINLDEINVENLFIIDHPTYGYFSLNKKEPDVNNFFYNCQDYENQKSIIVKENKIINRDENETILIINSLTNKQSKNIEYPGFTNETDIHKSIIERTNLIANNCNVIFPVIDSLFPQYINDMKLSSFDYLKINTQNSFQEKFSLFNSDNIDIVKSRIKYELSIIYKLNVADYFLIIWDLMKWGRKNDISFGPGRGSSAGSIICYLLDITEINPLEYGLLFERFLNPERVSMPDIDIDVQDDKREILFEYIKTKYGFSNVAQIITFQRMTSKSAFRDVSRVLNIPNSEVNIISKLIPFDNNLTDAFKKSASFRAKINEKEIYTNAYNQALKIENLPRQKGTHAAGVIISQNPLVEKIPVIYDEKSLISQFSMDYLESWGMLKIDLLGLKTLSTIQNIITNINNTVDKKILFSKIPLNDERTNALLSKGNTIGIFQLESPGMINTLRRVKVNLFEDLVAIISLFRPGPMSNISTYIKMKNGEEKIIYLSKEYDSIVSSTYGIIIYQEQIMKIAQEFAGMSFGKADLLRRAISKKNKKEILEFKQIFIDGSIKKNRSLTLIEKIYTEIEKFSEYGFNRSHAVAYATLSYRMAYLKSWYPIEFYTAIISSMPGLESINKYVVEARSMSYKIHSPEINLSKNNVYSHNNEIFIPLIVIKGLGKVASDKIITEISDNGLFTSFYNFIARAKKIRLGDAIIDILIYSNALRKFGNIATLIFNLSKAKAYAECVIITQKDKIKIDFNLASEQDIIIVEQDILQEINFEKKYLGAVYNAFPTINYETKNLIKNLSHNVEYKIVLFVEEINEKKKDKNGNLFGIITVSDTSGREDIFVFYPNWEKFKEIKASSLIECRIIKSNQESNYSIRILGWRKINEK
ncbi:MAG: DNA polymerase III subunit alpha [Mycoplasmataceae bacterium]|nr:DNA polymerase III subunit alpha [Mycoplasmataceae bacterium]